MENSCCTVLDIIAIFLGLYVIIPRIQTFYNFFRNSFLLKKKDLIRRYSKNEETWAVVTGCTSGIGEELAYQLAQEGFHIVLISRNMDRLKNVEKNIKEITKGKIKTKIVQANFSKGYDLKIYDQIYDEVKDLDIGMLVNNAGVNTRGYFKDTDISDIYDMTVVNTYPYTFLTHKLLPKLKSRKHAKSLILTVCSVISASAHAYDACYAASKVFESVQFEAMRIENQQSNLDFLLVNPQYVSTNNARLNPGGFVETAENFGKAVLKAIGNTNYTYGTMKHNLFGMIMKEADRVFKNNNYHQYINERVIKKKADSMWEKRI